MYYVFEFFLNRHILEYTAAGAVISGGSFFLGVLLPNERKENRNKNLSVANDIVSTFVDFVFAWFGITSTAILGGFIGLSFGIMMKGIKYLLIPTVKHLIN